MATKVIDIEIRPTGGGIRALNEQLKDLKKNVSTATDTAKIEKLNKALQDTEQEVKDINTAISGFDLGAKFDDVYQGMAPLSSQLGELEDRMYQLAFSGKANTEEFKALQAEAIKMRQTIIQVDRQVDIMADNQGFSVFGDGLTSVGDSLARMDFETASKQAQTLANNASKISFKQATDSIKQMGQTFASLGKALLTNPLFIIAAVIGLIVVGIIALLDKLGILKIIFEAIGDAIGWVVQQLKDFLDWLGITDYEGEANAQRTIDRNKRLIESENRKNEAIIDGYDHQIEIAKIRGEDTYKLEQQRVKAQRESAYEQMKLNGQILVSVKKLQGVESDEYKEAVKNALEAKKQFREANQAIEVFDAQHVANMEKSREEANAKASERAREANAKAKQYAQDRLNAERQIEDLRISLIKEDSEREIEENRVKFARLIEDTKKSTTLTQTEKDKIVAYYEAQSLTLAETTNKKKLDAEAKTLEDINRLRKSAELEWATQEEEISEIAYQASLTDQQKEIIAIQDKYFQLTELARQHNVDTVALEEEQKEAIAEIDKRYAEENKAREQAEFDRKIGIAETYANSMNTLAASMFEVSNNLGSQDDKAREKRAKRQFNIQKALNLSLAVIDGVKAVQASIAQAPIAIGPIPSPMGIASLAFAVATSVANIAKIASSKYGGAGGGASTATASGASSATASASSATPNISMFGQSNDMNSLTSAKSVEATPVVKAVVVESDITSTQKRVSKINDSAVL